MPRLDGGSIKDHKRHATALVRVDPESLDPKFLRCVPITWSGETHDVEGASRPTTSSEVMGMLGRDVTRELAGALRAWSQPAHNAWPDPPPA